MPVCHNHITGCVINVNKAHRVAVHIRVEVLENIGHCLHRVECRLAADAPRQSAATASMRSPSQQYATMVIAKIWGNAPPFAGKI